MLFLFLIVMFFGSFIYFVERGVVAEPGYHANDGFEHPFDSEQRVYADGSQIQFGSIFEAMYFVVVTMTTVGYVLCTKRCVCVCDGKK